VGPSQIKHEDPIDDLLPPLGEEEDPFFIKPSDGMEGSGATKGMHNPSGQDSFSPVAASSNLIPDDWDDEILGQPAAVDPNPTKPSPNSILTPQASDFPDSKPTPTPEATTSSHGQETAARAFLKSVGAEHLNIENTELLPAMVRMGSVMKTMITGLREILMTRSSIKSEFRIDQTMISAGGNNPLKFSISPEQAVEAMIKPTTRGYLEAGEAASQALNDIKAHEIAMVTGMEAALKGVLQRLNPAELVGKIENDRGFRKVLKGKKALYWDVYEKMYGDISDQAKNDFHELFSREFSRAYKSQLEKLK